MRFFNFKAVASLLGCIMMAGFLSLDAQGLVVNEFSNGPAGTQEYFEFVVVGAPGNPNCGPIDIRGWIFDDNNGDFSCGACAGTGIASGHFRFASQAVWSAVPTGSIIVVYDPAVKNPKVPADDPTDTSPADGVYVLPTNHASIEGSVTPCASGNVPSGLGACGSCTGNISYVGACYATAVGTSNAGLRNNGDAAQVRRPNGTYFHGVGYGDGPSLINGGPDNLFLPGSGSGNCYAFTNTTDDNFRQVMNWTTASVGSNAETPGLANGVANAAWIASLSAPCLLPVSYYQPLQGQALGSANLLSWVTASESNSSHFELQRATRLEDGFTAIGRVEAAGNSQSLSAYRFEDGDVQQSVHWYRLVQVDLNGQSETSGIVEVVNALVENGSIRLWPQPASNRLHVQMEGLNATYLQCTDLLGRVVARFPAAAVVDGTLEIDITSLPQGQYLLLAQTDRGPVTRSFSVVD